MNNIISFKTILAGVILSFALLFSFSIISSAQNIFDLEFPVPELGNCGSMDECKVYCDDPSNARVCTDWAITKGFIQPPPEPGPGNDFEARKRQILNENLGPGGCNSPEACDIYCDQPEHGNECFEFGK